MVQCENLKVNIYKLYTCNIFIGFPLIRFHKLRALKAIIIALNVFVQKSNYTSYEAI